MKTSNSNPQDFIAISLPVPAHTETSILTTCELGYVYLSVLTSNNNQPIDNHILSEQKTVQPHNAILQQYSYIHTATIPVYMCTWHYMNGQNSKLCLCTTSITMIIMVNVVFMILHEHTHLVNGANKLIITYLYKKTGSYT